MMCVLKSGGDGDMGSDILLSEMGKRRLTGHTDGNRGSGSYERRRQRLFARRLSLECWCGCRVTLTRYIAAGPWTGGVMTVPVMEPR